MSNDIASNRSTLKEFLASIATISGDLSNITAPPFVLAENSTVEIPQYWADHPLLFVAPASEPDAEKRALLVLKWFLGSLRNQQYAGRKEDDGVKKPLNAFLGEMFIGSWKNEKLGETRLISEQVSHHPPITACYLWNDKHGIRAQGFTQQEITFSGSVNIKQKGYAVLHIDKYDEDYLIPVPNVKVKGILGGVPYPELQGEYSLISSNGYVSRVKFEGKGLFGSGQKNGFEAQMFHTDQPKEALYTIEGAWNGVSTISDSRIEKEVEKFDVMALESSNIDVVDIAEQDPWESRRAWGDVIAALRRSDMRGTTDAKSLVEEGQRQMRKDEETQGTQWRNVFFQIVDQDPVFSKLAAHDDSSFTVDPTGGIWKVNQEAINNAKKPYHGDLQPTNQKGASSAEHASAEAKSEPAPNESPKEPVANTSSTRASTQEPSQQSKELDADAKSGEGRSTNVANGIPHESGGTWETLTNNVSAVASTITSQFQGVTQTASGTLTGGKAEKEKVASDSQPQTEKLTSPEISDSQVEEFLRAKTKTS